MQKAKEYAKEVMSRMEETEGQNMEQLKPAINNFLHMHLPDHVTVKECEVIAMVIFDMICDPYKYVR